jgi:23S rRNA (pseudouridine1915-N3)-methyltransferase
MRLDVVAVGHMRGTSEEALITANCTRALKAGRQMGFDGPYVSEVKERKGASGAAKQKEESLLLEAALDQRKGLTVMLDETGKTLTSRDFAKQLKSWQETGAPQISFVIGGADGLSDTLRQRSDYLLSLGTMTWPHMLARALLCEQLWRAISILGNHPYHRD